MGEQPILNPKSKSAEFAIGSAFLPMPHFRPDRDESEARVFDRSFSCVVSCVACDFSFSYVACISYLYFVSVLLQWHRRWKEKKSR